MGQRLACPLVPTMRPNAYAVAPFDGVHVTVMTPGDVSLAMTDGGGTAATGVVTRVTGLNAAFADARPFASVASI